MLEETIWYCQEEDDAIQTTWSPLSKQSGLPLHLSISTGWLPPWHAALMQLFMQKEPQPSIEGIEMNTLLIILKFSFKNVILKFSKKLCFFMIWKTWSSKLPEIRLWNISLCGSRWYIHWVPLSKMSSKIILNFYLIIFSCTSISSDPSSLSVFYLPDLTLKDTERQMNYCLLPLKQFSHHTF